MHAIQCRETEKRYGKNYYDEALQMETVDQNKKL